MLDLQGTFIMGVECRSIRVWVDKVDSCYYRSGMIIVEILNTEYPYCRLESTTDQLATKCMTFSREVREYCGNSNVEDSLYHMTLSDIVLRSTPVFCS